ncbi:MAG TPA: heavy metal translocating P-type ATPase [Solirubrobacteraceae bacterium]|nr:heavy metal translocating P-type ATPase [Solirubrobacteraceae bacterium]
MAEALPSRRAPAPRSWVRLLRRLDSDRARLLAGLAVGALAAGGVAALFGEGDLARIVWGTATGLLAAALAVEVVRTVRARGGLGVDVIALVAMAGAIALGEELAGIVVGVMFSGGAALEQAASRRARRELTLLIERAPKTAHLRSAAGLRDVPVEELRAGDVAVVGSGEVVPVDGSLVSHEAVVDMSALSGEPLPLTLNAGERVLSGSANAGSPFEVKADRPASESAYAAVVRLVERAQAQRAPFVRMADRYATFFLPATLVLAGLAWAASGEAVRALAVVVVATPCPLILAAPIALVSGVSRAARAGVVVKGAAVIETLGAIRTVLFDKTGTLTVGMPEVREVLGAGERAPAEVLRLAASVDQLSAHVLGEALAAAARDAGLELAVPSDVTEEPGEGIAGTVEGHRVAVGSRAYAARAGASDAELAGSFSLHGGGSGEARVIVALDGRLGGVIVMGDELRPDARGIIERLRGEGVAHVAMLSGDRRSVAERIGSQLGIDRVYAEQSPADKLEVVTRLRADAELAPVMMVGDGVNDAPALAAADVGMAMGAAGATVASETADAVITVDRIDRVADAVHFARRSMRIARQSVLAGMGMSIAAMCVAAAGYLPPVEGALLQEVIDLAVILNALRALRG